MWRMTWHWQVFCIRPYLEAHGGAHAVQAGEDALHGGGERVGGRHGVAPQLDIERKT
jgi:hypothetical protein